MLLKHAIRSECHVIMTHHGRRAKRERVCVILKISFFFLRIYQVYDGVKITITPAVTNNTSIIITFTSIFRSNHVTYNIYCTI